MEVLIASYSLSAIFLIVGLIWKFYPPKKINALYGYRTRRSMANQEIWTYANEIGANMFLALGVILLGLSIVCNFIFPEEIFYISLFAMFLGLAIGIYWCETQLNKSFDKNGNPKSKP